MGARSPHLRKFNIELQFSGRQISHVPTLYHVVQDVFLFDYLAHEIYYLPAPPLPVVGRVVAPVVYPCGDVLGSEDVVKDKIAAKVDNGVLTITMPKVTKDEVNKIQRQIDIA